MRGCIGVRQEGALDAACEGSEMRCDDEIVGHRDHGSPTKEQVDTSDTSHRIASHHITSHLART